MTLDGVISELEQARDLLQPLLRGTFDFGKVQLEDEPPGTAKVAKDEAEGERQFLDGRRNKIEAALTAIRELRDDKYPDLPLHILDSATLALLKKQYDEMGLALGRFTDEGQAATAKIETGSAVPKA